MSNQVNRRALERWLLAHGFIEEPGRKTSHRQFSGHGIKISVPGHGPQDLTRKHVGLILRQLQRVGFDAKVVREELG